MEERQVHVTFEGPNVPKDAPKVTITGLPSDQINRPERILKLMDLLELPEGTNARLVYTTVDNVIR